MQDFAQCECGHPEETHLAVGCLKCVCKDYKEAINKLDPIAENGKPKQTVLLKERDVTITQHPRVPMSMEDAIERVRRLFTPHRMTVKLLSGGELRLEGDFNLFDMSTHDRQFVSGICDALRSYSNPIDSSTQL